MSAYYLQSDPATCRRYFPLVGSFAFSRELTVYLYMYRYPDPGQYLENITAGIHQFTQILISHVAISLEGYKPVPGTTSFVKIVLDPTKTWFQSKAECEKDVGGRLVVPSGELMQDYLNHTMMGMVNTTTPGDRLWLGGQSTTQFTWLFLDGESD